MKFKKLALLAWLWFGINLILMLIHLGNIFLSSKGQGNVTTTIDEMMNLLFGLSFPLVGALIISHQPQNTIGWLLMLPSFSSLLDLFTRSQIIGLVNPPTDPSIIFMIAVYLSNATWLFAIMPIFLIALLFPTGRPLTPRWRWVVVHAMVMLVIFIAFAVFSEPLAPDNSIYGVNWSIPNPIGFLDASSGDPFFFDMDRRYGNTGNLVCAIHYFTLSSRHAHGTQTN